MSRLADIHRHSPLEEEGEASSPLDAGKPLPTPEEACAASLNACESIARHLPWTGPLIEAAVLCDPEARRPLEVHTRWGGSPVVDAADADEGKHAAYSDHILRVIHGAYPWLLPLLDAAKATLLVYPGTCCFTVHSRVGMLFDIPQLEPLTHLTPFVAEDGDVVH